MCKNKYDYMLNISYRHCIRCKKRIDEKKYLQLRVK